GELRQRPGPAAPPPPRPPGGGQPFHVRRHGTPSVVTTVMVRRSLAASQAPNRATAGILGQVLARRPEAGDIHGERAGVAAGRRPPEWTDRGSPRHGRGQAKGHDNTLTRERRALLQRETAFQELLKLQSGPYLVHQEWLQGERQQRGEAVRFTLIA